VEGCSFWITSLLVTFKDYRDNFDALELHVIRRPSQNLHMTSKSIKAKLYSDVLVTYHVAQ
jgi:hypothetical protein